MSLPYHHDRVYLSILEEILEHGVPRTDRTGVGTLGMFGMQRRYDLSQGFPLLTSKRIPKKSLVGELLWFLSGDTNGRWLQDHGITIWDEWMDENGDLGPVYGAQWRNFGGLTSLPETLVLHSYDHPQLQGNSLGMVEQGVDQIAQVVTNLKNDPFSRRHIVSAWNPLAVEAQALPPCHTLFQFHVEPDSEGRPWKLNCQLYQRSGDTFLGVPFNIASYSLLTHMVAKEVGLEVGAFVHTFGDAHIYTNHLEQVAEQITRKDVLPPSPTLVLAEGRSLLDTSRPYRFEDITFEGYSPLPTIKAPVAV